MSNVQKNKIHSFHTFSVLEAQQSSFKILVEHKATGKKIKDEYYTVTDSNEDMLELQFTVTDTNAYYHWNEISKTVNYRGDMTKVNLKALAFFRHPETKKEFKFYTLETEKNVIYRSDVTIEAAKKGFHLLKFADTREVVEIIGGYLSNNLLIVKHCQKDTLKECMISVYKEHWKTVE